MKQHARIGREQLWQPGGKPNCLRGFFSLIILASLFTWMMWLIIDIGGVRTLGSPFSRGHMTRSYIVSDYMVTIRKTTRYTSPFSRVSKYEVTQVANDTIIAKMSCDVTEAVATWSKVTCGGIVLDFGDMPYGRD